MKFLYFYRVPVPDPRADAVQIVHTCAGIARAGAYVALQVETAGASLEGVLRFYGVEPLGPAADRMDLLPLGRRWSWPFLAWKTAPLLRAARGKSACLFVREVRPYVPGLMARAKRAGLTTIYEAHNVSARLVEEKEARAQEAQRAELRAKLDARAALERRILAEADGVIATQQATLDALLPLIRSGVPAIVLGNGTKIPAAAHAASAPASKPRDLDVLYCGSLKPWKGVDTLVAAMGRLAPYQLAIVGPGTPDDVERLEAVARNHGADDRVDILPPVPPSAVWDLYARAKVGAIPLPAAASVEARTYTSPLKLFEMMAAGLPIVASRLDSLQAYVAHEREALLAPPDDPAALAEALRRVLTDEGLRAALSAAARARASSFTWDARGRRIVEFAADLARRATSPA